MDDVDEMTKLIIAKINKISDDDLEISKNFSDFSDVKCEEKDKAYFTDENKRISIDNISLM